MSQKLVPIVGVTDDVSGQLVGVKPDQSSGDITVLGQMSADAIADTLEDAKVSDPSALTRIQGLVSGGLITAKLKDAPWQTLPGGAYTLSAGTTSGSATVTSATNGFTAAMVGMGVVGTGIPVNATLLSVESAGSATLSANATATAVVSTIMSIVVIGTTNPNAAGVLHAATTSSTEVNVSPASFSLFGARKFVQVGTQFFPDYGYVKATHVTTGSPSPTGSNFVRVSANFRGASITCALKGVGTDFFVKFDGRYISLTPHNIGLDTTVKYFTVNFGGTVSGRLDFIFGSNMALGGFWVPAAATLTPAARRGPTCVLFGDSFGEGNTGTTGESGLWGYANVVAELLGWDDIIVSAVGSTGFLAATSPKVTYRSRIQSDLIDLQPRVCIASLSINDTGASAAALMTEIAAFDAAAKAGVPGIKMIYLSPTINKGAGSWAGTTSAQHDAAKISIPALGSTYLSDIELPVPSGIVMQSAATASAVAAGATTFTSTKTLQAGGTYRFADGTRFYVKSAAGTFSTVDKIANAQLSGAAFAQVGNCYLTGTGRMGAPSGFGSADEAVGPDNTHPSKAGHLDKGTAVARLICETFT